MNLELIKDLVQFFWTTSLNDLYILYILSESVALSQLGYDHSFDNISSNGSQVCFVYLTLKTQNDIVRKNTEQVSRRTKGTVRGREGNGWAMMLFILL